MTKENVPEACSRPGEMAALDGETSSGPAPAVP